MEKCPWSALFLSKRSSLNQHGRLECYIHPGNPRFRRPDPVVMDVLWLWHHRLNILSCDVVIIIRSINLYLWAPLLCTNLGGRRPFENLQVVFIIQNMMWFLEFCYAPSGTREGGGCIILAKIRILGGTKTRALEGGLGSRTPITSLLSTQHPDLSAQFLEFLEVFYIYLKTDTKR